MNKHLSSIKKTAVLVAVSWLAVPAFAGIGGFVDAQVGGSKDVNPNSQIADGAVYLTKELGRGKLMIDIPFSFRADSVDTTGAQPHTAGFASAFRSFNKKAQASITWGYDFGLSWTLGRFDSPFLNEAQDTVGLGPYAAQGAIFGVLPNMHNGLMLTYGNGPLTVMGIVSRPAGLVHTDPTAVGGSPREDGQNFEWGFLGKYTHDMMYAGAGLYLFNPGTKDTPATTLDTYRLIEIMAGTKMGDLSVDAQAVLTKSVVKNSDSGFALGATINYAWDKMWTIGVRPNYISKINPNTVATATPPANQAWYTPGAGTTWEVTVGPQANMTDDLKMRANYTWTSTKANPNASSVSSSAYTLSAVYKF